MKIGVTGHIATESIAQYLRRPASDLPPGYYGAPLLGTLIGSLLERGHTVHAFTTSHGLPLSPNGTVVADGERFRVHYCPVRPHAFRPKGGKMGRAFDFFRMERAALRRAMIEENLDIVHAHWSYEFALAAMETGLPYLVTCHDAPQMVLRHSPDRYRLVRYLMARRVFRQATFMTAVSPYLKSTLQKYANVSIEVVPNPISQSLSEGSLKHRWIDPKRPRIAMVLNGWSRMKNPKVALLAFTYLKKAIPGAELSLFGSDFGTGGKADRWIRSHVPLAGIHCIGRLPHSELLRQLSCHDILLHPSLTESFGMGVAEAMALGLTIVAGNNCGGVPWVIGDAGITTDITSPKAIAAALESLIRNPDLYQEYSHSAANRARTLFAPRHIAAQYERYYHSVLQQPTYGHRNRPNAGNFRAHFD